MTTITTTAAQAEAIINAAVSDWDPSVLRDAAIFAIEGGNAFDLKESQKMSAKCAHLPRLLRRFKQHDLTRATLTNAPMTEELRQLLDAFDARLDRLTTLVKRMEAREAQMEATGEDAP